ncbi:hypothetical protein [Bacillus alkalicellulosilyticus]|uniref:hypothetical protein n=1 Tax=Alkalihalobacterium alkalicellulosilyticum TaxID=1912214 RepID=UPI0009976657|nr:hypothetical protein [Bacillus alkalicellulosilyticus]
MPKALKVDGEYIEVFEYESKEEMEQEASNVPGNGDVGLATIDYSATPYYFKKGYVIVHYAGDNEQILKQLVNILGKPFAGGAPH